MEPCGGFPDVNLIPGAKGLKKPFCYKGRPVLYFAGEML